MLPHPLHVFLLSAGLFLASLHHTPPCSAAADGGDTLMAGQALALGDKLVSGDGKFALGFFQVQAPTSISNSTTTTTTIPGWYLGIWFNKIPVFTTAWVANRENPITAADLINHSAHLKISRDGNLAIILNSTASSESMIWSTHIIVNRTTGTSTNTSALLMNNGNLVLMAENPSSSNVRVLWQSFDYPADVGLPGAKLGRNKITGLNRLFISKKSLTDLGLGSYTIELGTNGVLFIKRRRPSLVYWSWSSGQLAYTLVPLLNELLDMDPRTKGLLKASYVHNNEEEYFTYTSLDESISAFVYMDITGQVKLKVWSRPKQSWQTIYAEPSDPCSLRDACGPFTVCNGNSVPFCDCMEGFSPRSPQDWDAGDPIRGCVRSTPLDCRSSNLQDTSPEGMFHTIARVTMPSDPESVDDASTQSKCEQGCLANCSCTAYSYNGNRCSVWHGELRNVNQNDGIDDSSEDVLYLRLAARDLQSIRRNTKRKPRVVAMVSTVGFGLLVLMLLLMVWIKKFKWRGVPLHGSQGSDGGIIAFRYIGLVRATKSFSERLGGGGFGSVFKGMLGDRTAIAVKRLDGARQGEKQFRAEVSSVGMIQHINLVKLIGFCYEGDKRLLVYEHMPNGSLDAHLFRSNATILNWSTRHQIAIGVGRGLCYLHRSCRECIIHCDIKPENILLDESFVPKIADFGMAAIVGRDFSRILTTFRGTVGYLAPEWLSGVAITPKVDVYSFGMVLLEIISGRRNLPEVCDSNNYQLAYFPVQAINRLREGDVRSLVDPRLEGVFNLEEAERVCKVACWCIQDIESDRPTMCEVVRAIEGLCELDMPPMPRLLAAITEGSHVISMQ